MKSRDSYEGTISQTHRESYAQQNQEKGIIPTMILTSRSNFILDEDDHEGLPGLPLESPLNRERIIQRHMYLKQDYQLFQQRKSTILKIVYLYEK